MQQLNLTNGYFSTRLENGTYSLQVMPDWQYRATYSQRSYKITVLNGAITEIKDPDSSTVTTADTDGFYPLYLNTPTVTGTVVNPQGVGVSNIQVLVAPLGSLGNWRYSTNTDSSGKFGLVVPDGDYSIQAVPYGGQTAYGKSVAQSVHIAGGIMTSPSSLSLALRTANIFGRIVTPGASPTPLSNVNINMWIDGEYFYGWTGADGTFGFFVDNPSPRCPQACSLMLNYYNTSDYTPKNYPVTTLGDLGDLAIGGVTTRLTVLVPQSGGKSTPNSYSYVYAETIDTATGTSRWVTGGNTNDKGVAGLNLDTGNHYRIWAYPSWQYSGTYSAKFIDVPSFDPVANATLSLTFDVPNFTFTVKGSDSRLDSWAWFSIYKLNAVSNQYEFFSNNHLDGIGTGGANLADGTYQITFTAMNVSGVPKTVTVSVVAGVATVIAGNTSSVPLQLVRQA
jgi:hypothetical protein